MPVTLTPKIEGKWRWVGAKTLLFEPTAERLPMATEFTATLDPKVQSKLGKSLEKPLTWTFKTPAPKIIQTYPRSGTFGLEQLMFLSFDQQIEPQEVLKHLQVKTGAVFGSANLELASPDRIDKDETIKRMTEQAKAGTWMVIQAKDKLPYDSTINLKVLKGTPSKEGPRTTQSEHNTSFKTYGPLKVTRAECGWGDCRPSASINIELSNNLDDQGRACH